MVPIPIASPLIAAIIGFWVSLRACISVLDGWSSLEPLDSVAAIKPFTSLPLVKQSSTPVMRITAASSIVSAKLNPVARERYICGSKAFFLLGRLILSVNTLFLRVYSTCGSCELSID